MKHQRLVFVIASIFVACSFSQGQQISHDELVEILGIRSWRVPSPKHKNRQWSIEIVDYAPRKFDESFNAEQLDPKRKALIVLRTGETKDAYLFLLKQGEVASQGELKIDICAASEHTKADVAATEAGGKQIHSVSGPPPNSLGNNGDYAVDLTAKKMYGPKASGVWGDGASLMRRDTESTGAAGEYGLSATATPSRQTREDCDNSYDMRFYEKLKPFDNGTKFLLAEISEMISGTPRQQMILEMAIIRPE